LPPVEKRLPTNPLVVEPWEETGRYGGTLRYCEITIDYDHCLRHFNEATLLELPPSPDYHRYSGLGGPIQPGIIESWSMSPDGRTLTATIRDGLKWSDGVAVTTGDVRYTFEDVYLNTSITPVFPTALKFNDQPVMCEVVDSRTFRLKCSSPYGALPYLLRQWRWNMILRPSHYMKQFHTRYRPIEQLAPVMKKSGFSVDDWPRFYNSLEPQIGFDAGRFIPTAVPNVMEYPTLDPWLVVSQPSPGEFVLERNPYYYKVDTRGNQLPYIDRLHRKMVANSEMMVVKTLFGETDVQFQFLRLEDYPLLKESEDKGGYKVMLLRTWQTQMLVFFMNLSPEDLVLRSIVQDVRFRQALSLALNRDEIRESLFLGFGRPAQATAGPGSASYEAALEKPFIEYDPNRANRLLDEMGLRWDASHEYRLRPDGKILMIPIIYYDVTPAATAGAELAAEYWRALGIKTPATQVSGEYFWKLHGSGRNGIGIWWLESGSPSSRNWYGGFFLPAPSWRTWYDTKGQKGDEPLADARRAMELNERMYSTASEAERTAAGSEILQIQARNLWVIGTVTDVKAPFVYSTRLGNVAVGQRKDFYPVTIADGAVQWYFKD
jgi:peptide/nickel transport system substrate-binding protein